MQAASSRNGARRRLYLWVSDIGLNAITESARVQARSPAVGALKIEPEIYPTCSHRDHLLQRTCVPCAPVAVIRSTVTR
jgi:hypothetical protein